MQSLIETQISLDAETNEVCINLDSLYQFFDSLTLTKLQKILKVVNTKIKNVILDNFIDVQETNGNINPFYTLHEQLKAYDSPALSAQYFQLSSKISKKFSTFMTRFRQENPRKFKAFLGKRDVIFQILKRFVAMIKSCVILDTSSQRHTTTSDRGLAVAGSQQRSILGFFSFQST